MMAKIDDELPIEVLSALAGAVGFQLSFDRADADAWVLFAGHGDSHVQYVGTRRSVCAFLAGYGAMQIQTTQLLTRHRSAAASRRRARAQPALLDDPIREIRKKGTVKKSDSESTKLGGEPPALEWTSDLKILLARVAGDVASGVMSAPSELTTDAAAVAKISVDVAEAILEKAGFRKGSGFRPS